MIKTAIFSLFLSSILFAQTEVVTLDLNQINPELANQIRMLNNETQLEKRIERFGKWVGLGKEVGVAVSEGLSSLNEETNKFADTRVGKYVMFIIAFKILGYPITQLIVGFTIFMIGTIIFIVYFFREGLSKRFVNEEKTVQGVTTKSYGIKDNKYKALYSFLIYVAHILLCVCIIFVH